MALPVSLGFVRCMVKRQISMLFIYKLLVVSYFRGKDISVYFHFVYVSFETVQLVSYTGFNSNDDA
jgi:hypothetical protein